MQRSSVAAPLAAPISSPNLSERGSFIPCLQCGSEVWIGEKAGIAVRGYLTGAIERSPLAHLALMPPRLRTLKCRPGTAGIGQEYFLPNATLFSYMVAFGEVLVGIASIISIFTRISAFMGVLMNLAFLLAGTSSSNPIMLVIGLSVVLVGGIAVGYYGIDGIIRHYKLTDRTRRRLFHVPQLVT